MNAQISVEFLFGLSLVLAFMVMIVVPSLQEFELTSAASAARIAVANFTAFNSSVYSTGISLEKTGGRDVRIEVGLVDRSTKRLVLVPDSLKKEIASSVQLVVGSAVRVTGVCASSSIFSYCVA